jgi:hypothetical protein
MITANDIRDRGKPEQPAAVRAAFVAYVSLTILRQVKYHAR